MHIRRLAASTFTVLASGLLAACTPALENVFRAPVYNFVTTDEVALRDGAEDESPVIAMLPRGTPVAPVGVNSECNCWQVDALGHTGYLYTRYIAGPDLTGYIAEPNVP